MAWPDPAAMTNSEIETELADVVIKLAELLATGSKLGELEARKWRLQAERRFREQRDR
jgi:hypothetical protein